jgi:hypothetical protein
MIIVIAIVVGIVDAAFAQAAWTNRALLLHGTIQQRADKLVPLLIAIGVSVVIFALLNRWAKAKARRRRGLQQRQPVRRARGDHTRDGRPF